MKKSNDNGKDKKVEDKVKKEKIEDKAEDHISEEAKNLKDEIEVISE